jgi:hypothetical protein
MNSNVNQRPNSLITFSGGKEGTPNTQATLQQIIQSIQEELVSKATTFANRRGSATVTDSDIQEAFRTMSLQPTRRNKTQVIVADALIIIGSLIAASITTTWWATPGLIIIAAGFYVQWMNDL